MVEPGATGGILGVLHAHTTWSDGEFTLADLRETLLAEGCRFVALADHAEAFDREKLDAYVRECARCSDERFVFLPGLEFLCHARMHVAGYGCALPVQSQDPAEIIAHIVAAGGVAVLAHPREEHLQEFVSRGLGFHGLEAWNTKYDGQYAPRVALFDLVERRRAAGADLHAFFGVDLHWVRQFRGLRTVIRSPSLRAADLLDGLRTGAFVGAVGELELAPDGSLPPAVRAVFVHANRRSARVRRLLRGVARLARRLGIPVPTALKNQIRRIM
jgi:hypothetical protein